MRTIRRGGPYYRVADPDWDEPLSGVHAQRTGGRWNPMAAYPVVYLNATMATARLNARRLLREKTLVGMPFSFDDLEPAALPCLVVTSVPDSDVVDCVTDDGLVDAGLPGTYPDDGSGGTVPWATCQPVGVSAHDAELAGVAARSAAPGASIGDEELAWFTDHGGPLTATAGPEPFAIWFGDY